MANPDLSAILPQLEQQHGLPPGLLQAVMKEESGGNPKAVSPVGAQGAFQFMPATAKEFGVNAFDPMSSAQGAAKKLGGEYKAAGGDLDKTLAAWNRGEGNIAKNPQNPPATDKFIAAVKQGMGQPQDMQPKQDSPFLDRLHNIDQQREQNMASRVQEEQGIIQQMQKEVQDLPTYNPVDLPTWKPSTPPVNTKEYKQFATGLLALGLVFGARGGKAGFQAAADSINGALKGYLNGNLEVYKQKQEDFKREFDTAMAKARESQAKIKSLLENKGMTLSMLQSQLATIGHEYDRQDLMMQSQSKDILALAKHYDDQQLALQKMEEQRQWHSNFLDAKAADRALREKKLYEDLGNSGFTSITAKQISTGVDAIKTLTDLKQRAIEDPRVLQATVKVPFFENAEQMQQEFKAGNYPVPLRTTQTQELYNKQVEYWKDVNFAVEKLAAAQGGSRAFAFIKFMLSIKPGSSDDPHLALHQLDAFQKDTVRTLESTLTPYESLPKYHNVVQHIKNTLSGLDMGDAVVGYDAGEVSPSQHAQPTAREAKQPQRVEKILGGKKYVQINGKWYEE